MGKLIRNTLFTATVLSLTALGLGWNRGSVGVKRDPAQIDQAVLASSVLNQNQQDFPLQLAWSRQPLKLGQYQVLTITTVPQAELEIVTIYPDGRSNNPQTQTAVADQDGQYQLRFQLDDFRLLGRFYTYVTAVSGGRVSAANNQFDLETWGLAGDTPTAPASAYVHPLLP